MITLFAQCLAQCIQHSVAKTVIGQQIMPFRPFIETSNSQDARNLRMLIQIHKRRLNKRFKGSRTFILENRASRPLTAIRLFRTIIRSDISRSRIPTRSHCRHVWNIELTVMLVPKFESYISCNSSVIGQLYLFRLETAGNPIQWIIRTNCIVTFLLHVTTTETRYMEV